MNGNFVTIVPHGENIELIKDTGQIPYHFHKTLGYNSTFVTYYYTFEGGRKNGPETLPPTQPQQIAIDYPNLGTEVTGLKIEFLKYKGRGKFYEKAIVSYLKKNAKKIDILHLFHFNSENIFYTLLFKFLNPKGKVYLKLDLDIDFLSAQRSVFNVRGVFGQLKSFLFHNLLLCLFFKKITLISAESEVGLNYFKDRFKKFSFKISCIPNGIDRTRAMMLTNGLLPFYQKKNIVLTVGRIGTGQKNNELMLETIAQLPDSDWKFYFAGPVTSKFEDFYSQMIIQHPCLKERIVFTGSITNRSQLLNLYNCAKIFWLTSKFEGFPIAAVEAANYGNVLFLHENIHAANTLTNHSDSGIIFNDENVLEKLSKILADTSSQEILSYKTSHFAEQHFSWENLVKKINTYLS